MSNLSESLKSVLNNKYVSLTIIILLTLYASLLGPKLPDFAIKLFNNNLFKIVFFFFFLLIVQKAAEINVSVAILTSIAFVLTVDYLYLNSIREDFKNNKRETFN